jgi:hypothetical protein
MNAWSKQINQVTEKIKWNPFFSFWLFYSNAHKEIAKVSNMEHTNPLQVSETF